MKWLVTYKKNEVTTSFYIEGNRTYNEILNLLPDNCYNVKVICTDKKDTDLLTGSEKIYIVNELKKHLQNKVNYIRLRLDRDFYPYLELITDTVCITLATQGCFKRLEEDVKYTLNDLDINSEYIYN